MARMLQAAAGRCSGLPCGTYDYSAACGIAAAHQSMDHPAADHAKAVMQVAAAGSVLDAAEVLQLTGLDRAAVDAYAGRSGEARILTERPAPRYRLTT